MSDIETTEEETQGKKEPSVMAAQLMYRRQEKKTLKILELAARGLNATQIMEITKVSHVTIKRVLNRFKSVFVHLEKVDAYRNTKADILAAAQVAALESAFSGNKLAKASFISTINGFDVLNKAERLEREQSTSNVSVRIGHVGNTSDD